MLPVLFHLMWQGRLVASEFTSAPLGAATMVRTARGVSRPRGVLAIGDRVVIDGVSHVLVGVSGTAVRLASADGAVVTTTVTELLAAGNVADPRGRGRPEDAGGGGGRTAAGACWRRPRGGKRHIVEVIYGLPPDAPAGTRPRPEYDMERLLADRAGEGQGRRADRGRPSGVAVSREAASATVGGRRPVRPGRSPGDATVPGVRAGRPAGGRPRCARPLRRPPRTSTRTASFVIWRTEQIVKDSIDTGGEAVVWPSQRSLYRLFDKVSAGKHTTGSASTRRSLAARPEGMFAARTGVGARRGDGDRLHAAGRDGAAGRRGGRAGST